MLPVESPEQCGACQVLPDAEEERPPYFAGYGNVNFIRFAKRASTFLESRPPGKIIMQWHSLSLLQKSPEALAKFIIERNIAHYKKNASRRLLTRGSGKSFKNCLPMNWQKK
jgi:hypothetical protein